MKTILFTDTKQYYYMISKKKKINESRHDETNNI